MKVFAGYEVRPVSFCVARALVERYHYAGGASNTGVALHGLFPVDSLWETECIGVAWWLPTIKAGSDMLSLSRVVLIPDAPKNSASFLVGRSMRLISRKDWPVFVTYASEWQGHTGAIYRATNWVYKGKTKPEAVYTLNGKLISKKCASKNYTHEQMLSRGCEYHGHFAKHKYMHFA